jgi:hypothetical protein
VASARTTDYSDKQDDNRDRNKQILLLAGLENDSSEHVFCEGGFCKDGFCEDGSVEMFAK